MKKDESVVSVFDIQKMAENTTDVGRLEEILLLVPKSNGTPDQMFALKVFINGRIRNPGVLVF